MARKTSTVLLMMTGTLVALVLVVGAGAVLMTEYEATIYEYEVTGTYRYLTPNDSVMNAPLSGTVNTTHMNVFGFERVTTVSDITYQEGGAAKQYDISKKWSLFTEMKIGEHDYDIDDFETLNYGIIPVSVYVIEDGNETITRYIGQDDGIVYCLERIIVTETEDGQELETNITQHLINFEETMMPIKI